MNTKEIEEILYSFQRGNFSSAVLAMIKQDLHPLTLFWHIADYLDDETNKSEHPQMWKLCNYLDDSIFASKVTEAFYLTHKWEWKQCTK